MRSCRHVLCVCAVLADVRLANVKKPLIPSTSGWLVAGKKAEKSKKRPIDFLYGLSSLRIRCIQRPNARILLRKWPESGRQHRIYVSEWNENSNVIATKTTTEQPKQKKEMNTNTQTNDNIVWIWKRTTREDKKHTDRLPSRFRCLATTEWYTRNSFAPLLLPTIGECWKDTQQKKPTETL